MMARGYREEAAEALMHHTSPGPKVFLSIKKPDEWIGWLKMIFLLSTETALNNRRAEIINKQTVYWKHKWNFYAV